MALRAIRDTYGYEQVTSDVQVRRLVKAGQFVPDFYVGFEDEGAIEDSEAPPVASVPQYYKHQLDEKGQVLPEHAPPDPNAEPESDEEDEEKPAARKTTRK